MDAAARAEAKAATRKAAFARRKESHASGAAEAAEAAAARFLREIDWRGAEIVSGYAPIRTEIDPTPLLAALASEGVRIALPVIDAKGAPLLFRAWTPGAPLIDGPFGAQVPPDGPWLEPRLLITPLVAFDARLNRLGYGGGFYDRTLERLRARRPTRAIGYAFEAQRADAVPQEPTDQPLDAVVTEARTYHPAATISPSPDLGDPSRSQG